MDANEPSKGNGISVLIVKPTKYRCKKCGTEILCREVWSGIDFTFTIGTIQTFSTGPICPKCTIDFIKANIPAMEVVDENTKKAVDCDDSAGSERAVGLDNGTG